MKDAEVDKMIRETMRINAEASLIMAKRHLEDVKKGNRELILYPALIGAGIASVMTVVIALLMK